MQLSATVICWMLFWVMHTVHSILDLKKAKRIKMPWFFEKNKCEKTKFLLDFCFFISAKNQKTKTIFLFFHICFFQKIKWTKSKLVFWFLRFAKKQITKIKLCFLIFALCEKSKNKIVNFARHHAVYAGVSTNYAQLVKIN